ncbi:MAG: LPS export ABC transporter ATP-binding protein [Firmicutes bacterium]|jgi:lipopolysaccharide export system ATP-binding protein|nr:LPS export ABC transporter ATP-binding protein [Bacillota bacterium]HQD39598.1 LPS export ABC transporter ATP-binding protein [Bacillota bacterium]
MIQAVGLEKSFSGRKVVSGVDLEVNRGEVVGLLGSNGAGKTTTFYLIVGLERAEGGRVFLEEADVTGLPLWERAKLGISYLAQEPSVFRKLTVEENILAILQLSSLSPAEQDQRLNNLLREFDLTQIRKQFGYQLSGGERRRTEIARALALEPGYLLLDEPFSGVDPIAVAAIQELIVKLKAKGIGILITDHNVRETLSIVDRAYIMHNGKILTSGSAAELAEDPIARKYYLGDSFRF